MSTGRPVSDLSFVTDTKHGRFFWSVEPSGDYAPDGELGDRLALEYLAFEEATDHNLSPPLLPIIVRDMPRKHTGVEIAFLTLVCLAASAGANRARQVATYWERCRAAEAAKTKRRRA
jgi:hypothetical protein